MGTQENLDDDGYDFDGMAEITEPIKAYVPPAEEDLTPYEDADAHPRGYMTKEAWVASGKPAGDWVSEEIFKERGERIKQTAALKKENSELKREFDNQIKNLSLFHQIQLKNQREELLSKRDDAIDVADKAAVKAFDKQLKELDDVEKLSESTASTNNSPNEKAPEILKWEKANPWCFDGNDPRTKLANSIFKGLTADGESYEEALSMVDTAIAAKFSNKASTHRQIAEGARTAGGKRDDTGVVSMKTLTKEEQSAWDSGLYDNEKDFLKTVATYRKEAKK